LAEDCRNLVVAELAGALEAIHAVSEVVEPTKD
jgi:hypothetical protein